MTTGRSLLAVLAAIVAGGAVIREWLRRREIAALRDRAAIAEVAAKAATSRAEFAEAVAETAVAVAERKAAAHVDTEEIRNVPSTGDPTADVRAIDDAVRAHAHRTGADRRDTPGVRRRAATDTPGGRRE